MRILIALLMMAFAPIALGQKPGREPTPCDYLDGMLGSVDYDRDGVENCKDNCPGDANLDQKDSDGNGRGDVCEWRERRRREWEESGRELRQQAREPVDLSKLIAKSSDVVLGRLTFAWSDPIKKEAVMEVEVIRRFKDSTDSSYQQYNRPMWVLVRDDGPLEMVGELLLFLRNDRAREWRKPAVWPEPLQSGIAPEGLKYFSYELTDLRYGVLGVSSKRLIEIERIIKSRNSTSRSNKRLQLTAR
jgi:hypothetical protein